MSEEILRQFRSFSNEIRKSFSKFYSNLNKQEKKEVHVIEIKNKVYRQHKIDEFTDFILFYNGDSVREVEQRIVFIKGSEKEKSWIRYKTKCNIYCSLYARVNYGIDMCNQQYAHLYV